MEKEIFIETKYALRQETYQLLRVIDRELLVLNFETVRCFLSSNSYKHYKSLGATDFSQK